MELPIPRDWRGVWAVRGLLCLLFRYIGVLRRFNPYPAVGQGFLKCLDSRWRDLRVEKNDLFQLRQLLDEDKIGIGG